VSRHWRELTAKQLIEKDACPEQVRKFRRMFGASVRVTEARAISVADKFDFQWAADVLLSAPALAEYERVTVPAWAEYERVRAAAWARAYVGDRA
jgi:hypothetical protein